jgi:hypothetical protein
MTFGDQDIDMRVIALEHAVKVTPGYKSGGMTSTGYDNPGTPPAEQIVQRATAYYDFLRGATKQEAE